MPKSLSARSFHLTGDYAQTWFVPHVPIVEGDSARPKREIRYEIVQSVYRIRQLTFKISPHYHPWVRELTQQLLRKSVRGLMDADTDYHTPVTTSAGASAERPDGKKVTIAKNERVNLLDGTVILGPDGQQIRLAGRHVVTIPVAEDGVEQKIQLTADDTVTIPKGARIIEPKNGEVTLTKALTATLIHNGPVPRLFTDFFTAEYQPNEEVIADQLPVDDIAFDTDAGYAVYNWELFFHIPLTLAIHLSRNGQYQDAMSWFHFVFNPTDDSAQLAPERYWKVKPFQTTEVEHIESILTALSVDPGSQEATVNAVNAWRANPFRPHLVARYRHSAYMYKTVMAYLDNLIAWGDSLFRQDTGEAIDEAMQLYVLAANVLGPRPQKVPTSQTRPAQTYSQLRADLDPFSNALREAEGALLFDHLPRTADQTAEQMLVLEGIGKTLYFGIPRNDKLLSYWDTVADRLFKIRNSLNIGGAFRRLALFEPPIDPAMLTRATAAGLSPADAMSASAQLTPLRFTPVLRQAVDLAQHVSSLGQSLLAAMEKEDGEALTLLRSKHEQKTAELATEVRYTQVQEATKSKEAIAASINSALLRYTYYERLLGRDASSIEIPQLDEIDRTTLAKQALNLQEPSLPDREVPIDIIDDVVEAASGHFLNRQEGEELDKLAQARTIQDVIKVLELSGKGLGIIPDFAVKFHFWGLGGDSTFGGTMLSRAVKFAADTATTIAERLNYDAGIAAKIGSYARREQEWAQQSNTALAEIAQLHKQLRSAQLREAIAQTELANHVAQIAQLAEINLFLNEESKAGSKRKVTNKALYTWNKREVRNLYNKAYKLAYEVAVRAQTTLEHELGETLAASIVRPGHMSGKEGLLAGDKLLFELKQLENHYLKNNKRELEVVRHVSLAQLNPLQLLTLRTTGKCTFTIPEEWYDLEGPSHYFRRIQSVAVTIPCVTGPHTSINCSLTLTNSTIRKTANLDSPDNNPKQVGMVNAIVASSAQQDPGISDPTGDMWRPFELYGAASTWTLELPGQGADGIRTFDYDTISDVILTIRFTAREGGATLRKKTTEVLQDLIQGEHDEPVGNMRLFSLRHEFPAQWAQLINAPGDKAPVNLTFEKEMFPYWSGSPNTEPQITQVDFYAATETGRGTNPVAVERAIEMGLSFKTPWVSPEIPNKVDDIWVLVTWTG